jgi:hypothetical protein
VLTRAYSSLLSLALLASRVVCLIVIAWFVVFAVDQTKTASQHQQNEISGGAAQRQAAAPQRQQRSTATKTLDEAAKAVTQPFASLTSKDSNEWLIHGLDLLLALLIYGLAVGFVARLIRLRV